MLSGVLNKAGDFVRMSNTSNLEDKLKGPFNKREDVNKKLESIAKLQAHDKV